MRDDQQRAYSDAFRAGHRLLAAYKSDGGTQGSAYNTVMRSYLDNRHAGGEAAERREDRLGDWLDCLSGWICGFGRKQSSYRN